MSKYIEVETYEKLLAFGITLSILKPEIILQIDFYKWAVKVGRL